MSDVVRLRLVADNLLSDARSVERLVSQESFRVAFQRATPEQTKLFEEAIVKLKHEDVRTLIRAILHSDKLNIRELRDRAAELQIKGYSRMSKEMLIALIRSKEDNNGSSSNDRRNHHDSQQDGGKFQKAG